MTSYFTDDIKGVLKERKWPIQDSVLSLKTPSMYKTRSQRPSLWGETHYQGMGLGKNPIEETLSPLKQHDGHNVIQLEQYTAQGIHDTA